MRGNSQDHIQYLRFNLSLPVCGSLSFSEARQMAYSSLCVYLLNLYDRDGLTNSVGSRIYEQKNIKPESQAEQITNNNDKNKINKT